MTSVFSRFSDASATALMWSGRLLTPPLRAPVFRSMSKPNLVAITTLIAHRRERLADEFLVGERAIGFGGVEQGHAALDRRADQRNPGLLVDRRAIGMAQSHAAEADRRDLQATLSEFALQHDFVSVLGATPSIPA